MNLSKRSVDKELFSRERSSKENTFIIVMNWEKIIKQEQKQVDGDFIIYIMNKRKLKNDYSNPLVYLLSIIN